MPSLYDTRRHLTNFDSSRTANILTDCLVVGSGVAGMRAAIEAALHGEVILLAKEELEACSTAYAQGGIAAAKGAGDTPEQHFEDTMRVGCGLNDAAAVELLVRDAPARIDELASWGMDFDRHGENLALGLEGGHGRNRIVHSRGDQTGRELMQTLERRVRQSPNIRVFQHCFLIDLLTFDGVCVGGVTFHRKHGHQLIWAKQTIIATGGCGQLWRETTNPATITGDGLAAAFRAGAALQDMEFMQFHPTTLYLAGAARALISEAVRGEGAYLVDRSGRRFMLDRHPDGELAPRDVVSRAIHEHMVQARVPCVFLDVRHIRNFSTRFPGIAKLCADFAISVERDLIPVRPSAHYLVGGVVTDLEGATNVAGLSCCGEAASSGVHGANRMASNSLLEGLVFGRRTGAAAGAKASMVPNQVTPKRMREFNPASPRTALDLPDVLSSLRSLMGRNVGIVRTGDRLVETLDILNFWGHYVLDKTFDEPDGWELQNQLMVARAVALSAVERCESLGVHYRGDAADHSGSAFYHTRVSRHAEVTKAHRVPHTSSAAKCS